MEQEETEGSESRAVGHLVTDDRFSYSCLIVQIRTIARPNNAFAVWTLCSLCCLLFKTSMDKLTKYRGIIRRMILDIAKCPKGKSPVTESRLSLCAMIAEDITY